MLSESNLKIEIIYLRCLNLKYFILAFFCLILVHCSSSNPDCAKFESEEYHAQNLSDVDILQATHYHGYLLDKYRENPLNNIDHDAYQLIFHSSHGFGRSVKFEKIDLKYLLTVHCVQKEADWVAECQEYQIEITSEEWDQLENMIYEFNYWTEPQFKPRKDVLDGYVYVLEGNRPQAKICDKSDHYFVIRSSPQYDKIGALCRNIIQFEDELAFKYGFRKNH